jgi:hypothetical protein
VSHSLLVLLHFESTTLNKAEIFSYIRQQHEKERTAPMDVCTPRVRIFGTAAAARNCAFLVGCLRRNPGQVPGVPVILF